MILSLVWYSRVYVHLDTFGDDFTGQITQPTVSKHWRTMVSQPCRGPIPPSSAR